MNTTPYGPRMMWSLALAVLVVPLALRSCGPQEGTPNVTEFAGTAAAEITSVSKTVEAAFSPIALTALRRTQDAASTEFADTPTAPARASATPTDILAIGPTPEAAALAGLKAWATVPYQNERAELLQKSDQQARVRVSAEFKDAGSGAWVRKEAVIQCLSRGPTWKCIPVFSFALPATATPGS